MGLQQYVIFVVTQVKALTIPMGRKKMQDTYFKIGLDRDLMPEERSLCL